MKKFLTLLLTMALALTFVFATSCSTEQNDPSTAPVVEVTGLNYVYDGTAKRPTVKVTPADAGSLSVSVYQNGTKVTEAVDAGTYDVKISLSDTDEPFEDITKQMVIAPKPLDVSAVKAVSKQYDNTDAYEGKLSSVGGICGKDDVNVTIKGNFADSLIGENKTVTVKEIVIGGEDKANYSVTELKEVKASVVKRVLTISGITVTDKDADGTTVAEWTGTPALENVIEGDEVSVEISEIEFPSDESGAYDMKVTATLSGKDAGNYVIDEVSGVKGQIKSKTGDFVFDSKNGVITGYTGTNTNVIIPSEINGITVKAIGEKAFTTNDSGYASVKIDSVSLPDTLKTIGDSAFVNTGLTRITIPASVESIGAFAFYYCSNLSEVVFADGIGEISLGASTFRNTAVKNVKLPSGLTEIPALCFQDTTGDGKFIIPATITKLGDSAFLRSKYTSFVFEDGNADLVCEKQVFAGASMASFEIPARMVEIGGSFFQNAANLTSLTFAENRTKPLTAHKIEGAAAGFHLQGTGITSLDIPGSVGEVPDGMANNVVALESLTLGEGITKIGPYAFYGSALTSVTFPKSLTEIGYAAFQGSAVLEEISFVKGGTDDLVIGAWSFQACAITALEIPARTTSIGAASFAGNKIATLTFEAGGTKPLVFEDGTDPTSQGKGYHFDQCPLTKVVLPKRTVTITLPNVFIGTTEVTYES